jgi:hypothetical protein
VPHFWVRGADMLEYELKQAGDLVDRVRSE